MAPDTVIDLEDFDNLVLRVKGDGRRYLASMRTDDWIAGERDDDVWQAFIFARQAMPLADSLVIAAAGLVT